AHQNGVLTGADRFPGVRGDLRFAREKPEEHVGVQEEPHQRRSNSFKTFSGSGASKSFPIRIRPFKRPGRRGRIAGPSGTSRATGRPARAITISSPFPARSTRREKWVL